MRFKTSPCWLLGFAVLVVGSAPDRALAAAAEHAGANHAGSIASISSPNYRAIIDRYGPAVVGVTVEGGRKPMTMSDQNPLDGSLPVPASPETSTQDPGRPLMGLGTGFIISPDGVVVTNAHVIRGAGAITVTLDDRREFKARVLGLDPDTDIAVLKIEARDLPTVKLGDSDRLQVGDYVLAIGTPYGFDETATSGIVSAMHRPLPDSPYVSFIQTDAAVNPGNSGGPLFNASGEVVGINAQILSHGGGFEGLSFAIPINLAKHIADQIVATGKATHGWLGITLQQLTQPLADSFGLARPDGALVSAVKPHSAAAGAGLLAGDVILKCNNVPIRRMGDVSELIGVAMPDDTLALSIWRNGKALEISARMSQPPSADDGGAADIAASNRLGISVKLLSADERKEANVSRGLIVITSSGPAEKAGILPGDLVLSVNGTPIESVERLHTLVTDAGSTVALLIQRGDSRTYVPVIMD